MTIAPTQHTHEVLARAEANLKAVRRAEFDRLRLAREWALAHVVTDPDLLRDPRRRPTPLGAVGLPVDEYAAAEFAAALELHPLAGRRWMADGVDIEARLPQTWTALANGRLEVWVARKIAAATSDLDESRVRWVDAAVADVLGTLPTGRLLRLVDARVVEADQVLAERKAEEAAAARVVWVSRHDEHGTRTLVVRAASAGVRRLHGTIDHLAHLLGQHGDAAQRAASLDELRADAAVLLANPLAALKLMIGAGESGCSQAVADAIRSAGPGKVQPTVVAYLHLTPDTLLGGGVARAEELGALTRQQLIDLLGHHQVSLRPVIDLNEGMAADCYEVPAAIDERLQLSKPADVFPFASSTSRMLDRDHTVPYDDHGPPGQTTEPNLGKLTRHHHRIKTHGGWKVEQRDGRFTWTTPHGRVLVTDRKGTHRPVRQSGARYIDIIWSLAA
jgi:hypothetical protein